jgi:hypothetical protein
VGRAAGIMSVIRTMSTSRSSAKVSLLCAAAVALVLAAPHAVLAQQPRTAEPPEQTQFDPFGTMRRWFDGTVNWFSTGFLDASKGVNNFNREAGIAAQSTASAARDAAGAVAKLPNARVVRGHQNCTVAANGAPDCLAAATAMCKAGGFETGKSIDMTTAEECPAQVMLGRRTAEPGECKTVNFVTRALCQ